MILYERRDLSFIFKIYLLGKLPNYVQYIGSNIVEGVPERWVEFERGWVEVGGAGCMVWNDIFVR